MAGRVYHSPCGGTEKSETRPNALGWKVISVDPYSQVQVNYHAGAQAWLTPAESELWMIERGMESFPGSRIRELDFVVACHCTRLKADNIPIVGHVYMFKNPKALLLANPRVKQEAFILEGTNPPKYFYKPVKWVGTTPFDLDEKCIGEWITTK